MTTERTKKHIEAEAKKNDPNHGASEEVVQGMTRGWNKGVEEAIERVEAMPEHTLDRSTIVGELKNLRQRGP